MTYSDLEIIAAERARFIADANGLPREAEECIRSVIINVAAGYHAEAEPKTSDWRRNDARKNQRGS